MIGGYKNMFDDKPPNNFKLPLEKGDYPELNNTEILDPSGVLKFQSLIGSIQCAVSIGRLDVNTSVMSLLGYRSITRIGHMEQARRVVGYIAKIKYAVIRFRTRLPEYYDIPHMKYRKNSQRMHQNY